MEKILLIILLSYVIGCFTTGYYLVHILTGKDISKMHSGNVGSRNAGRVLGAKGFLITFVGDFGKGLLVVWLASQFSSESWILLAALIAVTTGHIWPIQLHFNGGKGLATYAGGMVLLYPLLLGISLVLCGMLYLLIRRLEKSVVITLALSPLIMAAIQHFEQNELLWWVSLLYLFLVIIILSAHRLIIKDLLYTN